MAAAPRRSGRTRRRDRRQRNVAQITSTFFRPGVINRPSALSTGCAGITGRRPARVRRPPMNPLTLEQPTSARLIADDDQELAVTVTLRYSSGDPFAVQLLFPAWISLDGKKVTWTFARALLEEGLVAPA